MNALDSVVLSLWRVRFRALMCLCTIAIALTDNIHVTLNHAALTKRTPHYADNDNSDMVEDG